MTENTPNRNYPYPSLSQSPYYDDFENMILGVDTDMASALDKSEGSTKLKRVDTGVWEAASAGVKYFSPDQHGGIYGKVIRKYYSGTNAYTALNAIDLDGGNVKKVAGGGGRCGSTFGDFAFPGSTDSYPSQVDGQKFEFGTIFTGAYDFWVDYTLNVDPTESPWPQ